VGQLCFEYFESEIPELAEKALQMKALLLSMTIFSVLLFAAAPVLAEKAPDVGETPQAIGGVVRYVNLKPTFITNYGVSDTGRLRYVKADVTVRVSNKDAEFAARYHLPALRNRLVLLLSRQDESTIASTTGRETIKAEALRELREVLEKEEGQPYIDDLMFTNFVVQR